MLSVQIALKIPSQETREGLLATQQDFYEHGQLSKVDDLTKLTLIDE